MESNKPNKISPDNWLFCRVLMPILKIEPLFGMCPSGLRASAWLTRSAKKMKTLTLLPIVFVALLSAAIGKELPKGDPIVAFEVTEDAFSGTLKGKNGVFFYSRDPGKGVIGPILEIYFVSNGKVTQSTAGGSTSAEVIEAIRKIGFQPFDYQKEKDRVDAHLKKEAQIKGEDYYPPTVDDGAEYRITYNLDGKHFSLKDWNPGSEIYFYANHSEKIRRLRDVISELCIYYGRLQFGMY